MRKLIAGVTVFVLVAGTAVWGGDTKKDKEKLQGTWTLTQIEIGGKKVDVPEGKGMQLVFSGDKVTAKGGLKGDEDGSYTIDASKKPKQITLMKKGGGADDTMQGIYEIEGNTLRIGTSAKGPKGARPTGFDDPTVSIMILKKAK
jgi:uncharacterized protein (TIGR03067 family)